MTLVDSFKEKVLELVDDSLDYGELGTSSQAVTVDDTDLILGEAGTQTSLSGVQASKELKITYNLNSVTGNGNTYTEFGNFLDDDTLVNRVVFTELPKTTAIEIQINTILQVI